MKVIKLSDVLKIFFCKQSLSQIFTYYIPAPPPRKNGYREKQFDQVINSILSHGFKVKSMTTTTQTSNISSGMWVQLIIYPSSISALKTNIDMIIDNNINPTHSKIISNNETNSVLHQDLSAVINYDDQE